MTPTKQSKKRVKTQTEFIKSYCKKSKVNERRLNNLGQCAIPCNCHEEDCGGWAMVNKRDIKDYVELYL